MKEQTVFNAINDVDDDILAHVIQEKELYEKLKSLEKKSRKSVFERFKNTFK